VGSYLGKGVLNAGKMLIPLLLRNFRNISFEQKRD
jgi:hypothetical protein